MSIVRNVTIRITAEHVEETLHLLINQQFILRNLQYKSKHIVFVTVESTSIDRLQKTIDQINKHEEIKIVYVSGLTHLLKKYVCRYEYILAFAVCIVFLMLCMNVIWKVDISDLSAELEHELWIKLNEHHITEGKRIPKDGMLFHVEQQLLKEIPNLLFISMKRRGNNIYVEAIEKNKMQQEKPSEAESLVASKNGIIQDIFIQSGIARVKRNQYVKKGDLLVSIFPTSEDEDVRPLFDHVVGKVFAEVWYELQVEQPLELGHESIRNLAYSTYDIQWKDWILSLPHYKNWTRSKEELVKEETIYAIRFFKWPTPFQLRKNIYYHTETSGEEVSIEERKTVLIEKALDQFVQSKGNQVEILMYQVLYDTIEKDKMKMNIYLAVRENIAIPNE